MNTVNCCVCLKGFNTRLNKPMVLEKCGHSVCFNCLISLIDKTCPYCKSKFFNPVKNFTLCEYLEINSSITNENSSDTNQSTSQTDESDSQDEYMLNLIGRLTVILIDALFQLNQTFFHIELNELLPCTQLVEWNRNRTTNNNQQDSLFQLVYQIKGLLKILNKN